MNRIKRLQFGMGIPLPETQWEILLKAAGLLAPVHAELTRPAAKVQVLFNNDTVMRILEKTPVPGEGLKAVYTSAILWVITRMPFRAGIGGRLSGSRPMSWNWPPPWQVRKNPPWWPE
jgi:hypothetical protein